MWIELKFLKCIVKGIFMNRCQISHHAQEVEGMQRKGENRIEKCIGAGLNRTWMWGT